MARNYQTQPGTVAHRVVKYLEAHPGEEFSAAELSDQLEIDLNGFSAFMVAPARHGLVVATDKLHNGRRMKMWKLGDGTPPPVVVEEDPPLHAATKEVKVRRGELFPPAAPAKPDVMLSFRTGVLTFIGLVPDPDGLVRVPAPLVDRMRRLLAGAPT